MTTLLAPARDPRPEAMLSGPRYSLLVSADREHREAAQRLRYRVFAAEPGFRLPAGMAPGIDADRFDEYCDHLLVRENHTGAVVGCYRMLPPDAARAAGGYYTATEFDLTALDPDGLRAVEMGRACVDPAHRSGSVLSLMWAGILRYLQLTGHNWVMGCVSVPIRTHPADVPGANVRAVRDVLLARHAVEADRRVLPRKPVVVDGRALEDIPPARPAGAAAAAARISAARCPHLWRARPRPRLRRGRLRGAAEPRRCRRALPRPAADRRRERRGGRGSTGVNAAGGRP